jgi:hypothetical protein
MHGNLAPYDTTSSVETKSYDAVILIVSGLVLLGLTVASYALAVIYGIERAPIDPVMFM